MAGRVVLEAAEKVMGLMKRAAAAVDGRAGCAAEMNWLSESLTRGVFGACMVMVRGWVMRRQGRWLYAVMKAIGSSRLCLVGGRLDDGVRKQLPLIGSASSAREMAANSSVLPAVHPKYIPSRRNSSPRAGANWAGPSWVVFGPLLVQRRVALDPRRGSW